jgi:hypothetical protein
VTLNAKDRRALSWLGVAVVLTLAFQFWPQPGTETERGGAPTAEQSEQRLERLRKKVAEVPGREEARGRVAKVLAEREKGLIQAETAAQAQAQMLQIVRRIAKQQTPPLDIRSIDPTPPRAFGDHYGEVAATVVMEARVDQVVNLLADLGNQPELIATSDVQFGQAAQKEKRMQVRLVIAGLVPKKLVPAKAKQDTRGFF